MPNWVYYYKKKKSKNKNTSIAGKDTEKTELLCIVGGNTKRCSQESKCYGSSSE